MNYISFSQYNVFKACPQQWKIIYLDKIRPSYSNIHLVFGTAIHVTLQTYLQTYYTQTEKLANDLDLNSILLDTMVSEIDKIQENDPSIVLENYISKNDLNEYYSDGVQILNWFKKHRGKYFSKKNIELVGIELPLDILVQPNLNFTARLDLVLKDNRDNSIRIVDFKKSYRGWQKSEKDNPMKRGQLQLYKQFYSEIYNVPLKNIDIEFMILKQKIFNYGDFPAKRIQIFSPPSSEITLKKVKKEFMEFVDTVYTNGEPNLNYEFKATPSKKSCQYCPFKDNKDLCKVGIS
jgi:hypothetical protein